MSKKAETEVKRGRPVLYPTTTSQVKSIIARLKKGFSVAKIAEELGIHEFAVVRVKRQNA